MRRRLARASRMVAAVILADDVWQAIHRLGLDDHLNLHPPQPLER